MKATGIFFSLSLFFAVQSFASGTLYLYYDEHGHPVYSDKVPPSKPYQQLPQNQTDTVSWTKSHAAPMTQKAHTKPHRITADLNQAQNACKQTSAEIARIEKQLKLRLRAEYFEQLKSRLSDLRWKYQRQC